MSPAEIVQPRTGKGQKINGYSLKTDFTQPQHLTKLHKSFTEWEELFGDPVIASAVLDRLLHHCRVINIKGNKIGRAHV